MSSQESVQAVPASPSHTILPLGLRSRRGSLASLTSSSQIDKEQLAQTLDAIHTTASQSETLTTFNEFAAPPSSSSTVETKGLAGELMQNGLSGLYSRFKGVVAGGVKEKTGPVSTRSDSNHTDSSIHQGQRGNTPTSKSPKPTLISEGGTKSASPAPLSSPLSRIQSPTASTFSNQVDSPAENQSYSSSKSIPPTTAGATKSVVSVKPALPSVAKATATASSAALPTLAAVNVSAFRERDRTLDELPGKDVDAMSHSNVSFRSTGNDSQRINGAVDGMSRLGLDGSGKMDVDSSRGSLGNGIDSMPAMHRQAEEEQDLDSLEQVLETDQNYVTNKRSSVGGIPAPTETSSQASIGSAHQSPIEKRRPAAIERIAQSRLPGYHPSRASSTDRSTVEASPVNTSAHNSVHHLSFTGVPSNQTQRYSGQGHIPGTTTNEGDPEAVSTRLEQMRKQVLSKEFWMADDICKECFLCGDSFTAFRRKHHCRTCGCIFDSKCTSIISGERFGVQGSLRVCKTCLDIINRRHDSSGSDDSGDDAVLPTSFFQPQHTKSDPSPTNQSDVVEVEGSDSNTARDSSMPLATPMMAIPATRRIGDSANRRSAILEIDAPQLSRPSSSRSLKSITSTTRPSSGHRRHQSKHNFLGRFRAADGRPPFHRDVAAEDTKKRTRLPAFHDDNIIDPDLAPYMSDEGSSGDEQMSIFGALNGDGDGGFSAENERSGFGSFVSAGKKHRARAGEKSVSGVSFTSRGVDDGSLTGSTLTSTRPSRRRNLSTSSGNVYHNRGSPRQGKGGSLIKGFANLSEDVGASTDEPYDRPSTPQSSYRMTRSASMRDAKAPAIELNNASLVHVRRLLRQLLQDADIPNIGSWEKALLPILLQCTDDVNPDVRRGDDIDIRHYVKLKKIPGGKPGDTSYVSGVVFTKNLALKSMPRSISHPRIVIISFPIEYQRHQQHFMSLEPVIAQEKEFLKNMVNRIASLRPQLLLVQSHISGLALQYLAEANIAVAYNVKQSVIEAVSRCAQTEIISSIDMVALKPVHVGKSAGFDVKTYVHSDIPGHKKTCIYISGCPKELGCTIVLRGASMPVLAKMKRITEFMVYVVYNLKLETCLMRDEFVLIPSTADSSGSLSPSKKEATKAIRSAGPDPSKPHNAIAMVAEQYNAVTETSRKLHQLQDSGNEEHGTDPRHDEDGDAALNDKQPNDDQKFSTTAAEEPKVVSAHESHVHSSHEDAVPEDIPMPTYYSDMVAKYQTKILSASPFVRFMQPYLLMRAREQERRLVYLKRLRDQDTFEEQTDNEKGKPQKFQLIQPEMVHETLQGAPKQIMEVLHAVHDAEYDKALHNYQTQTRQWENYIQGNLNLFDPYAHQNIVVLYTVVCTATTVPCAGPELLALGFYNEHETSREFDPDCTLGQYVEDLCISADTICTSNGCERPMSGHHRTYVHGEARITVFVEKSPCKIKGLEDSILMWSYCKICKKETQVMPMSESTWKYSFGKYLELSFWSTELHLRAGFCPHDLHRDHLRYFGYRNVAIRIHHDPIDLLEIIVPRTRITWKVDNDLRLKNDLFTKTEDRWNRFMTSVKSRIKGINIDSVTPEKAEACKVEVERLAKRAQDEHVTLLRKLQQQYMESKYYEVLPLNRAVREMQEKVAEWDAIFADFDANFFPSEKDIRRLAALQLKKMFMDRDVSATSLSSTEIIDPTSDADEKLPESSLELNPIPSQLDTTEVDGALQSALIKPEAPSSTELQAEDAIVRKSSDSSQDPVNQATVRHLDLAVPWQSGQELASTSHSDREVSMSADHNATGGIATTGTDQSPPSSSSPEIKLHADLTSRDVAQNHATEALEASDEMSGIPRPIERGITRRTGLTISPPLNRTQSQPAGTLRRIQPSSKTKQVKVDQAPHPPNDTGDIPSETSTINESIRDKKLSERLGLGTLKPRRGGHSLIPRSIQGKKRDSKVSTLAKHFEQLSREFEKERMRDRKQRAARVTQSRAFPKASSKPIVEVYRDVNEAVEERGPSDDDVHLLESITSNKQSATMNDNLALSNPHNPTEMSKSQRIIQDAGPSLAPAEETGTEAETDENPQTHSQTASDEDEGANSDVEHSLLDDIPGVADIAESLAVGETGGSLDLPKHEKTSLMKMLTNFWAERSASGWTQLEYPLNATDHVFVDSDVIVREDEPSSLIAFALSSEDYNAKLEAIRRQGQVVDSDSFANDASSTVGNVFENKSNEAEVETSLLRATGTHLKYQFAEGSARMLCKIFYAEQFDAVRRKCGVGDRIVESLSRCLKWDSKGGKTKSVFLKTLDDRLVLKFLSPIETQAFLRFAPAYFNIMAEALFHELPTVIAKMLGFYQIVIKNPVTGTEIKGDVLVMENLFYDRSPTRIFDLKGSMRNRKIQSTGEQNEVLLDENMVEFIYESPLFAREHAKKLLRASVWNDTLFLARQNVMDYSLMVAVDEARKELVVGIIDCIRTYTWDKKLESWIKDRGFAGGGRNRPTVTSPKEYKSRFREAMARYVLQAPNCWHQFATQQVETRVLKLDPKNEPIEGDRTEADAEVIN